MDCAVGQVSPCDFHQAEYVVCGPIHGDDFVSVGAEERLKAIAGDADCEVQGQGSHNGLEHPQPLFVLSRSIWWAQRGVVHRRDHCQLDRFIEEVGLKHKSMVAIPALPESRHAHENTDHEQQI